MNRSPKNQHELIPTRTQSWGGIGLVLLSALGFTISLLTANMAFKGGIDVHTINAARYSVMIVFLFLFQKIRGKKLKLSLKKRYTGLALGISVFTMGAGYLGATQYIPVSLAVLIFYSSPFFVAIISRFTENEPITIIRLIAIIIAFIGLLLALEIQSFATLDWQGVSFAFIAALGCAAYVTISSFTIRSADPHAVNFHCLATGAALFVVLLLFTGGPVGSFRPSGFFKLGVSSLTLTIAYVTLLAGLEMVGPVKTSMLLNAEPILTIIFAALLLGERLSPIQFFGAGLVITGIILITGGFDKKIKLFDK